MTTILTEIGWSDANGNPLGTWTNRADLVDEGDEITVAGGITANSLAGKDKITGNSAEDSSGIFNEGTINTGDGRDTITGTNIVTDPFSANNGIYNEGTINTGDGRDTITGNSAGATGIFNGGIIDTGDGKDTITGTSTATGSSFGGSGIVNLSSGTINTGNGKDRITATNINGFGIINEGGAIDTGAGNDTFTGTTGREGFSGISNRDNGTIDTGDGKDTIIGTSTSNGEGISNDGTINTGDGKDTVDALTGGFAGGGTINLGRGRDLIRGFGQQIVDGGRGFDTAELGIDFDENQITFGSTAPTSIDITFDSATMSFTDVELFDFNGQEFALEQLQDMV